MLWLSMYVSNARINPAKRSSSSHVTNIGITSPRREGKQQKEICIPGCREANRHRLGALRVPISRFREYYTIFEVQSQYELKLLGQDDIVLPVFLYLQDFVTKKWYNNQNNF